MGKLHGGQFDIVHRGMLAHDYQCARWPVVHIEPGVGQDVRKRLIGREIALRAPASHAFDGIGRYHKLHASLSGIGIQRRFQCATRNIEGFAMRCGTQGHSGCTRQQRQKMFGFRHFPPLSGRAGPCAFSARCEFRQAVFRHAAQRPPARRRQTPRHCSTGMCLRSSTGMPRNRRRPASCRHIG